MPAGVTTIAAPIGGLNAYDSLAGMPDTDAITLLNLFPQVYGLYLRRGYQEYATGLPASVNSLAVYNRRNATTNLYAWAGTGMYNVTSAGAVGAPVVSGLTNSVWQSTSFANTAGSHLIAFNGVDDGIWVAESGITRLTLGDGIVAGTWKDVDPKNLIDVTVHQRRVWAVQKDTTYGWYLPPDQIYGDAAVFDFGPLFKHGGYLQSLATWTVDDGDGADDMLVAISSKGDVAVYKGIDPSNAATWALTGVYYAGEPVSGRRFHTKVSGDIKFITQQGLVSLNDMLTSTKTTPTESTIEARNIQQPLAEAATTLGDLFGWEIKFIAPLNMLLINVPNVVEDGNGQFVENVVNGKWCQFSGYDAQCFEEYQRVPFFGGADGKVYKAWTGFADGASGSSSGNEITGICQQAYNYFGSPATNKQVGMYRPNFLVSDDVVWGGKVNYDFAFDEASTPLSPPVPPLAARWDVALWDQAYWAGDLHAKREWAQAQGMGVAASLSIKLKAKSETLWVSTDFTVNTSAGVF